MFARLLRLERWSAAALAAVLLTALFHGRSLWRGYHRWDDFAFLQMADRTAVGVNVFASHNDHLLPLWRLQVEGLHTLFGVSSVGYIALTLACFAAVLFALERFLAARQVGIAGRWLALVLMSSWSSWAEFTSGYFTLTVYLQLVLLFFSGVETSRRAQVSGGRHLLWLLALLMLLAVGLDVSGFWVLLAVPVIVVADGDWSAQARADTIRASAPAVLVCAVVFIAAAAATLLAARIWFPGLAQAGADQSVSMGQRLHVAMRVAFAIVVAPWRAIEYALGGSTLSWWLRAIVCVGTLGLLATWWRWTNVRARQLVLGLLAIVCIHIAMIAVGRPFIPTEFPAKHIGAPLLLFSLMVALLVSGPIQRARRGTALLVGAVGVIVLAQFAANIAAARRGYPVTAKVELELAAERERSVELLRDSLIAPMLSAGVRTIPTVLVGTLEAETKDLRFYDLSVYRPFLAIPDSLRVRFVRDATMPPSVVEAGVELVPDVWAAAGPGFREFVQRVPLAQRFWSPPASPP